MKAYQNYILDKFQRIVIYASPTNYLSIYISKTKTFSFYEYQKHLIMHTNAKDIDLKLQDAFQAKW